MEWNPSRGHSLCGRLALVVAILQFYCTVHYSVEAGAKTTTVGTHCHTVANAIAGLFFPAAWKDAISQCSVDAVRAWPETEEIVLSRMCALGIQASQQGVSLL